MLTAIIIIQINMLGPKKILSVQSEILMPVLSMQMDSQSFFVLLLLLLFSDYMNSYARLL